LEEKIVGKAEQIQPNMVGTLVEQSTHFPKLGGPDPASAGARKRK
jgi:hypothetical protein